MSSSAKILKNSKLSDCFKNQKIANTITFKNSAQSWKSVEKWIIYSQLRDLPIFSGQEQNFSKIHKTDKKKIRVYDIK
jgi:hypothetical protein